MIFMPFQILAWWLRAVITVAALAGGIALIMNAGISVRPTVLVDEYKGETRSIERRSAETSEPGDARSNSKTLAVVGIGWNRETGMLFGGIALVIWSLVGGWWPSVLLRPHDPEFPQERDNGVVTQLDRPDGTQLHVECFGKADGIPVILTHGWGLDSREWLRVRRELENRCRVIVWDLPGLGRSKGPDNLDWSLKKLAGDLQQVVRFVGSQPVILVGHSIGGMIILTYCETYPEEMSRRIAAIVLGQTTYKNPVETTSWAWFFRAIQKPLLEPLCYLMIGLAPIVWLMNWWSYCSGSVHRTNHKSFFSGDESREELNFISKYAIQSWPAVVARGLLGMFRFDATSILPNISVPTIVIAGDRDSTCLPQASDQMAQSIPTSREIHLKNAEHGGIFEFHKRVAESIHELISTSLAHLEGADQAVATRCEKSNNATRP